MGQNNTGGMTARLRDRVSRLSWKDVFPYLGLFAVVIFFQATTGKVWTQRNLKALLGDGFYTLIGSVGYIFIIAQGNLDFSIGGAMGLSCAVAAVAAGVNPFLAAPAAVLTGVAIGAVNGFIVTVLKLDSFIATMAFNFVLMGLLSVVLSGGILTIPLDMLDWSTNSLKIMTVVIIVVLGFILFNYTIYGKHCRAVGSSREAARQSGVNVTWTQFGGFIIMAGLAGLLGFFSLIRTGAATNATGADFFTKTWNAVLLGGIPLEGGATTKFRGVIIGSLTMTFLTNGMTLLGIGAYTQQLVTGIIFIIVVAISFNRKNLTVIK